MSSTGSVRIGLRLFTLLSVCFFTPLELTSQQKQIPGDFDDRAVKLRNEIATASKNADVEQELRARTLLVELLEAHLTEDNWVLQLERAYRGSALRVSALNAIDRERYAKGEERQHTAQLLFEERNTAKALEFLIDAHAIQSPLLGANDIRTLERLETLAGIRLLTEHPREALIDADASLKGMILLFGEHHPKTCFVMGTLARIEIELNEFESAQKRLEDAMAGMKKHNVEVTPTQGRLQLYRSMLLNRTNQAEAARLAAIEATATLAMEPKGQEPYLIASQWELGVALSKLERFEEARYVFKRVMVLMDAFPLTKPTSKQHLYWLNVYRGVLEKSDRLEEAGRIDKKIEELQTQKI